MEEGAAEQILGFVKEALLDLADKVPVALLAYQARIIRVGVKVMITCSVKIAPSTDGIGKYV